VATIGIVGYGIVGKAVDYGFRTTHPKGENVNKVFIYDKYKPEISIPLKDVVKNSEFVFVCLPTPMKNDNSGIDLTIMDQNIAEIAKAAEGTDNIIIIKSSVIPGTTRRYEAQYPNVHFAFNPEFLTEANYLEDFIRPDRIIIGADNDKVRLRVIDFYRDRFPRDKIIPTDPAAAEMVKYMANTFLATKVIFANEMYELCEKMGIKYEDVKEMVALDPRIGPAHFSVTSERGFGGKCFPKDTVALIGLYNQLGIDASLLKSVWDKNLRVRKHRDWEEIPFVKGSH